jgi:hypothetical protein
VLFKYTHSMGIYCGTKYSRPMATASTVFPKLLVGMGLKVLAPLSYL